MYGPIAMRQLQEMDMSCRLVIDCFQLLLRFLYIEAFGSTVVIRGRFQLVGCRSPESVCVSSAFFSRPVPQFFHVVDFISRRVFIGP
jgi:hypothetical protein